MTENQYGIIKVEKGASEIKIIERALDLETANELVKKHNESESENPNVFYSIVYGVVMAK